MKHEWTIRRIEGQLGADRINLAGFKRHILVERAVAKLLEGSADVASLPEGTHEERLIKGRLGDCARVLEASKPFGSACVEEKRRELINDYLSSARWNETKSIPALEQHIAELEDTLTLLRGDQAALAA